jgi:peroxiredoxin family protein/rhodanese-related sulfurtransferase/TusA-related sulfurtransferase
MTLKLIFAPKDGKILGAQIVGYNGVDKRIDILSTFILCNKTIFDLKEIEHAYAPPYSSAKDPVNMLGFVGENIYQGHLKIIHWHEITDLDKTKNFFLDVRTGEEALLGTIEGSVNIPLDDIRMRLSEIPKDKKIIIFCGVGLRGYIAARILMQNGFNEVYNLSGGYKTYELAIQKQDNGDIYEGYKIGLDDLIHNKPESKSLTVSGKVIEINACGLQCPGPIMKAKTEIDKILTGEKLYIKASDPGFYKDIQSWARVTGNKLISVINDKGIIEAVIEKSDGKFEKAGKNMSGNDKTIIVFNNDLDKAIASFVIAAGAIAMGRKVTMFFTFWGLNVIRRDKKVKGVKKNIIEKMFGMMLPRGSKKLSLSKMNMAGIGKKMIRGIMKNKNIDSLEDMIKSVIDAGAELIACQMSMDVMGIKAAELMDGVKIGGVATYLEAAEESDTNLFI